MSTPKLGNFPHGHGSKFQSVNTKTSQFSQFFDLHKFEKNMSTPKVWEKKMSTPKLVNFPHFLTCTSLRKTCQHQQFEKKHVNTKTGRSIFSIFWLALVWEKHVNTKTSQFSPFFGFQFEKKHVNTKTSQFSPFFGFQEFEKNMSKPKLVNFHHFWIPGIWEKHVNTKTS